MQTNSSESLGQFVQRLSAYGTAPPGMRIEGPVFALKISEQGPDIGPPYWNQPVGVTVQKSGDNRLIIKFNAGKPKGMLSQMKSMLF